MSNAITTATNGPLTTPPRLPNCRPPSRPLPANRSSARPNRSSTLPNPSSARPNPSRTPQPLEPFARPLKCPSQPLKCPSNPSSARPNPSSARPNPSSARPNPSSARPNPSRTPQLEPFAKLLSRHNRHSFNDFRFPDQKNASPLEPFHLTSVNRPCLLPSNHL